LISDKDVKYIANLSRIHLDKDEISPLTKSLEDILHYIEKLEKIDTTNIKPTSHVFPLENVFRKDEIVKSFNQDDALKFSIENTNGSFKVPLIIE